MIYFFVTLGSGTGWGVLGFLTVYLAWHGQKTLALIGILAILLIPNDQIEARDRLLNTMKATSTMEIDAVLQADHSAACRVGVFFSFIEGFKPWLPEFWYGQGAYTHKFANVGIIALYGFIAWLMQILQFSICCFRKVFSFEVLYFTLFVTLCVGNVVNLWAIMMVFTTLKYFSRQQKVIW